MCLKHREDNAQEQVIIKVLKNKRALMHVFLFPMHRNIVNNFTAEKRLSMKSNTCLLVQKIILQENPAYFGDASDTS